MKIMYTFYKVRGPHRIVGMLIAIELTLYQQTQVPMDLDTNASIQMRVYRQ